MLHPKAKKNKRTKKPQKTSCLLFFPALFLQLRILKTDLRSSHGDCPAAAAGGRLRAGKSHLQASA